MKVSMVLAICFLAGCAAQPSLEHLEQQALMTGDWSAVEARERSIQRRTNRAGIQCPTGYTGFCERFVVNERCTCINRRALHSLMTTN